MRKIVEAEILSTDGSALRITLTAPVVFGETSYNVIEGYSWGIEPEFDDDGEELDYDVLVIDSFSPEGYFRLSDEDIEKVEKAER